MNDYMVECKANCCYKVYKRKSFLFFSWWSFMCDEVTFNSAETLILNLNKINNATLRTVEGGNLAGLVKEKGSE